MNIIYRISKNSYQKERPAYMDKMDCLGNALDCFRSSQHNWHIIVDNIDENDDIVKSIKAWNIPYEHVSVGNGAGTFNLALNKALKLADDEIVYFIEDDYVHRAGSPKIIQEGLNLGASFVTLYNHPDKYIPPSEGGNPEVDSDGGYVTKIYRGETELFAVYNSTTMTFASKVSTLRRTEHIMRKWTSEAHPHDFQMFLELRDNNEHLLCPLNSYSTHLETKWLAPLPGVKQDKLANKWNGYLIYS